MCKYGKVDFTVMRKVFFFWQVGGRNHCAFSNVELSGTHLIGFKLWELYITSHLNFQF